MRKASLCLLLVALVAHLALAQAARYAEGDRVETPDGRTGVVVSFKQEMAKVKFDDGTTQYFMPTALKPAATSSASGFKVGDIVISSRAPDGVPGKIEEINGNYAKVRYGPNRYDFVTDALVNLMATGGATNARQVEQNELQQKPLRAAFEDDARPFEMTVWTLAAGLDSRYKMEVQFNLEPATFEKWRSELTALDAVCQRYPNLTNPPLDSFDRANIRKNPADWCKMAARREMVIKKMRLIIADQDVERVVDETKTDIDERLRNWDGFVKDDMQALVFDRAAWEQKTLANAVKKYAEAGEKLPADALTPLDEKIAGLRARIEEDAKTREWKQPEYRDAAFEATVRAAYLKQYPGVKVFNTGMTFGTWKAEDDTSLVGQGTDYKVYRTTKGAYRYKLGLALVKLPNQPYCQVRDFQFTQSKAGGGYGAARLTEPIAYSGMFVKCP